MKGPRGDRLQRQQWHCQILTLNGWGRGRWEEEQPQTLLADTTRECATCRKHGWKSICWRLGAKSQCLALLNAFLGRPAPWNTEGQGCTCTEWSESGSTGDYWAESVWELHSPISRSALAYFCANRSTHPGGQTQHRAQGGQCSPSLSLPCGTLAEWFKRDFRDKSRGYKLLLGKVNT